MRITHKTYTEEFRKGAVDLVLQGAKARNVADDLGIGKSTLSKWVRQAQIDQGTRTGLTSNEKQELSKLRRENHVLKMKREILKKATTFFAKESR